MSDKTMTADEVVSRLRSGMTLGIGGWGSRRKPMALVRLCSAPRSPTSRSCRTAARTSGCSPPRDGSASSSRPS